MARIARCVDLPARVGPNMMVCPKSRTSMLTRKGELPLVSPCISGGELGGISGLGAKFSPVQMVLVGIKSARFIVLMRGRRTFSTPWPGSEPMKASMVLMVSTRAVNAIPLIAFSS
ncbi:hypothetical protein D3C76_1079840 [compost metagenome]